MSTRAYTMRKAAGLCVYHAHTPARPGQVLCEACAQRQARYRAAHRQPSLRARMRAAGLRLVTGPPVPSPAPAPSLLLCCGTWWPITHIPLLVPCCHRLWLQAGADKAP